MMRVLQMSWSNVTRDLHGIDGRRIEKHSAAVPHDRERGHQQSRLQHV